MSADGFPPPPPPQPHLAPPPGAVGYQTSPWGATRLRRTAGIAKALVILLAVVALGQIITALFIPGQVDNAEDFLAGNIDEDTFLDEQIGFSAVSLITGAVTIAIIVLSMIWLFRVASNHRDLRRQTTWAPGWAIGGWFLPPLLYIIPTLMFRELWKASDPDVPVGGDWKSGRTSPLVWVWFVLYSLVPVILLFAQGGDTLGSLGGSEDQLAEQLTGSQTSVVIATAVTIAGAVAFVALARALTSRHRRLIGESPGR